MDRFKPASQSRAERPTSTKCSREQQRVTGKCAGTRQGQPARNSPVARLTRTRQRPMSSRFLRNSAGLLKRRNPSPKGQGVGQMRDGGGMASVVSEACFHGGKLANTKAFDNVLQCAHE